MRRQRLSGGQTTRPRVQARSAARASGLLGTVLLSYAPAYGAHSDGGRNFSAPFAIAGALLVLPWLAYQLSGVRRARARRGQYDLHSGRVAALRNWQALVACASMFTLLWLVRAPMRLGAVFAIATILAGICLLRNLGALSFALLWRDRARPLRALRWLALAPSSLAGIALALELAHDSWSTLMAGCLTAYLGPLLGGCPVWGPARRWHRRLLRAAGRWRATPDLDGTHAHGERP
ncbi:MAG TPA: hypothetical protein VID48_06055 [Solirubrobacteraceae bacterium]